MRKGICVLVVLVGLLFNGVAEAADWRFPVGFTYISGFEDVVDIYKENLEAEGFTVSEDYTIPVGLAFTPYVQLDSGVRIGGGIGPTQIIIVSDDIFYNIPVNINGGYTLLPSANTSPYVYGGIAYPIADGDYVIDSSVGFIGAVGVEFLRKRAVGFGFEVAYDNSEIEFEKKITSTTSTTKKVKPTGLMFRLFAVF
ncbi:MAG: hypothetical protein ACE5GF_04090 [Thermodesulfobacteriota bacterium]